MQHVSCFVHIQANQTTMTVIKASHCTIYNVTKVTNVASTQLN